MVTTIDLKWLSGTVLQQLAYSRFKMENRYGSIMTYMSNYEQFINFFL